METLSEYDFNDLNEFRHKIHRQEHDPNSVQLRNTKIHKEVQRILREGRENPSYLQDKYPLKTKLLAYFVAGSTIFGILAGAFVVKNNPANHIPTPLKPVKIQGLQSNPCSEYLNHLTFPTPQTTGWVYCRELYPNSTKSP